MRLWHISLIPYLPKQQLLAQWRECVLIAECLASKGTPDHILVNRVLDYPASHLADYGKSVIAEMEKRGYAVKDGSAHKFFNAVGKWAMSQGRPKYDMKATFGNWHNERYLLQCFRNLEEKYDCGGMGKEEYDRLCVGLLLLLKVAHANGKKAAVVQ